MKTPILAAALAVATAPAAFAADKYMVDPSHAQVIFSYNHLGFSTTWGMFSGWEGEIMLDEADPAASSVSVSIPASAMFTGWEQRDGHFSSPALFGFDDTSVVTFTSTAIEVTSDTTANITGDLTIAGTTAPVTLETTFNQKGPNPAAQGAEFVGFTASGTVLRSNYGVDMAAPAVSDEVKVEISLEAQKVE